MLWTFGGVNQQMGAPGLDLLVSQRNNQTKITTVFGILSNVLCHSLELPEANEQWVEIEAKI